MKLHDYVLQEFSQAQVRSAREAKRCGADLQTLQSVVLAVAIDVLVANTLTAARKPSDVAVLSKSITDRYRAVLKVAQADLRKSSIVVPDTLPPELS